MSALLVPSRDAAPIEQAVIVTSARWDSRRATLRRFERTGQGWVRQGRAVRAWLGSNGFAPARTRRQNSGQTPAGVFDLPSAFGHGKSGSVSLPYHRITPRSYWPYDPRDPYTYNVLQTKRIKSARWRDDGQWSERLLDYGRAYRYAVVIGYNLPEAVYRGPAGQWRAARPARTHKGGGIFLHVSRHRPTAGCVAIPQRAMREVQRWLVPQAQGTKIATFGLTEPNAGSDAGSIESTVVRDGDHYILNGAKMWISLADVADHFLVFASIDRSKKHHGLCAFMIERGMDGFTTGTIKGKLGVRAGNTGELAFNNVRVPVENRIGEEGEGFKIAMSCIDQGRFTVGAGAVGLIRASLDASVKYANEREAFGEPIGKFQLVQQMIAKMVAGHEASYLLTMKAAELKNRGIRNTRETSLMKWFSCDQALQAADDAIQIHGSYGFSNEYPVERFWRNSRGAVIYEGTREVHTLLQAEYALGYRKDKPLSHPQPPAQGYDAEELLAMTR